MFEILLKAGPDDIYTRGYPNSNIAQWPSKQVFGADGCVFRNPYFLDSFLNSIDGADPFWLEVRLEVFPDRILQYAGDILFQECICPVDFTPRQVLVQPLIFSPFVELEFRNCDVGSIKKPSICEK